MNATQIIRLLPGGVNAMQPIIIYVNNLATGNNNGTSWANAYTDLQAAVDNCVAGGQIWIKGNGNSNPYPAILMPNRHIQLYGGFAGNEASTLQRMSGNETVIYTTASYGIRDGSFRSRLDSLTVIVEAVEDTVGSGIYGSYTIINCKVMVAGLNFAVGIGTNSQWGHGYNIFNTLSIAKCLADGAGSYITSARGAAGPIQATNCTFIGIGPIGTTNCKVLGFDSAGASTIIRNCIAKQYNGSSSTADWYIGASIGNTWDFNYNLCPDGSGSSAGANNIVADPLFVSGGSLTGNYRLQSSSPGINAGLNSAIDGYNKDLAFNPRIVGGIVDIGAYEYQ